MSKIVISGYYGFANAGDEAMLTAIIKSLRSTEPSVGLTVISGNPEITATQHKVASIHRFNPLEIFTAIKDCDLLISGGGSLLQDVTSKRSLLYYLSVLALGRALGKKVMLFAQGIGPINSGLLRRLTKYVCSRVNLITVRDKDSLYELKRIGVPEEKVLLTADAVMTLSPVEKDAGAKILHDFSVPEDRMLVGISVRKWQEDDRYLLELAKAADMLIAKHKAHVVLLPLQYPADVAACSKLREFMAHKGESTVLEADCNTEEFLSLTGNFDILLGMRLHALIFAAVMGTPFAAVSYDPKVDGFIKDIDGVCAGRVDRLEAGQVVVAAEKAMTRQCKGKSLLAELRKKSMLNAKQAFSLLQK